MPEKNQNQQEREDRALEEVHVAGAGLSDYVLEGFAGLGKDLSELAQAAGEAVRSVNAGGQGQPVTVNVYNVLGSPKRTRRKRSNGGNSSSNSSNRTTVNSLKQSLDRFSQEFNAYRTDADQRLEQIAQGIQSSPQQDDRLNEILTSLRGSVDALGTIINAQRNTPQGYDDLRRIIEELKNQVYQPRQNQPNMQELTWMSDRFNNLGELLEELRGRLHEQGEFLRDAYQRGQQPYQGREEQRPAQPSGQQPQAPEQPPRDYQDNAGQRPAQDRQPQRNIQDNEGQPPQPPRAEDSGQLPQDEDRRPEGREPQRDGQAHQEREESRREEPERGEQPGKQAQPREEQQEESEQPQEELKKGKKEAPDPVKAYLSLRKQIENEITAMQLDVMLAYVNAAKSTLQVKGDIRQIDLSKLEEVVERSKYLKSLYEHLSKSAKEKMYVAEIKDDSHADSVMYGWFGTTLPLLEEVVESAKSKLKYEHIWHLSENRVKMKGLLPGTKVKESDTEKVLSYVGLKSGKDKLERGVLLNLINNYDAQGRITPEQVKTLNQAANAGLSYKQAA